MQSGSRTLKDAMNVAARLGHQCAVRFTASRLRGRPVLYPMMVRFGGDRHRDPRANAGGRGGPPDSLIACIGGSNAGTVSSLLMIRRRDLGVERRATSRNCSGPMAPAGRAHTATNLSA